MYYFACFIVFLSAYLINITYISVFYHRGLAHSAVQFPDWMKRWIVFSSVWVTGLDPLAWVCMHRLHHIHSDTEKDPHSPVHFGIFGVFLGQLRSYERCLMALMHDNERYTQVVSDLNMRVSSIHKKGIWFLPYVFQLAIALLIGFTFSAPLLGFAYFMGMMSHPIQGWMVNALGHSKGYRNFDLADNSTNNTTVALLVMGEGFQNNHHRFPKSPKFSVKPWEIDMGYGLCLVLKFFGIIRFPHPPLMSVEIQKTRLDLP